MKNFVAGVLVVFQMAAFLYSAFGLWPVWTMALALGLDIVYLMFTK